MFMPAQEEGLSGFTGMPPHHYCLDAGVPPQLFSFWFTKPSVSQRSAFLLAADFCRPMRGRYKEIEG